MARCGLCNHPDRDRLDGKYIANTPLRAIVAAANANPTGPHVSLGQAHRHKQHVKDMIRERLPVERAEHGSQLFERVEKLISETESILAIAKSSANLNAATGAINACTRLLTLLGQLTGQLTAANAPGLHLSLHTHSSTTINMQSDDREIAQLCAEATRNFDPSVIEHFRQLTAGEPIDIPERPQPIPTSGHS